MDFNGVNFVLDASYLLIQTFLAGCENWMRLLNVLIKWNQQNIDVLFNAIGYEDEMQQWR